MTEMDEGAVASSADLRARGVPASTAHAVHYYAARRGWSVSRWMTEAADRLLERERDVERRVTLARDRAPAGRVLSIVDGSELVPQSPTPGWDTTEDGQAWRRTENLNVRLTPDEKARLTAMTVPGKLGAWARQVLLAAADGASNPGGSGESPLI